MSEWREKEALIESKIDDCETARDKQERINATQSDWNKGTEKRIDKITDNMVRVMIAIAALMAAVVDNASEFLKMILGMFKA